MISKSNLKKPDHKKWKLIADIALYSLPFLTTAIMTMPVADNTQKWIIFLINTSIVGFKALSKFTSDVEKNIVSNDDTAIAV